MSSKYLSFEFTELLVEQAVAGGAGMRVVHNYDQN